MDLYSFDLPKKLISLAPASKRDLSRLLVYDTQKDMVYIDKFINLDRYLPKNSFLVLNDTKVLPAKVRMLKENNQRVEVLFLVNEVLGEKIKNLKNVRGLANKKITLNEKIFFPGKKDYIIPYAQEKNIFTFRIYTRNFLRKLEKYGKPPLPLYLRHTTLESHKIKEKYQTIFAKKKGSVAAPTASLHFTKRLFKKLKRKGIKHFFITLHIGLGTFSPLTEKNFKNKKLHPEYWEIEKETFEKIKSLKKDKQKLVAVGTTTTRVLETAVRFKQKNKNNKICGYTELFILPPFKFKMIDCLITNFHLPHSSLMMLVEAFLQFKGAKRHLKELYKIAIKNKFRFYSFGDAMLIT